MESCRVLETLKGTKARKAAISQRDLAAAGLDFSYISKLENDRIPSSAADTVVAICTGPQG